MSFPRLLPAAALGSELWGAGRMGGEGSLHLLSCTPQLCLHLLTWSGDSGFPLQSNGVRNVVQRCL